MDTGAFRSRVGAAAFSVGLGLAIATSPGTATADNSDSDSSPQVSGAATTPDSASATGSGSSQGTSSTSTATPSDPDLADEGTGGLRDADSVSEAESDTEIAADIVGEVEGVESAVDDDDPAQLDPVVTVDDPATEPAATATSEVDEPTAGPKESESSPIGIADATSDRKSDGAGDSDAFEADSPTDEHVSAPKAAADTSNSAPVDVTDLVDTRSEPAGSDAVATLITNAVPPQQTVSAAANPEVPATVTQQRGLLSGLLSLLTSGQLGAGTDLPAGPAETFAAMLQLIRRDFEKLSASNSQTADPTLISLSAPETDTALVVAAASADGPVESDPEAAASQGPVGGFADLAIAEVGGVNSGNVGDELWGEAHFAPYVDMAGWPVPNLIGIAAGRGVSLLNLGFVTATADGQAAWGGFPTLTPGAADSQAQSIDGAIAAFKAAGGDVMISLGGANGTTLAQSHAQRGLGAEALANVYVAVADFYSLNRIDFDIEGAAAAESASIALRSEAIALLQQTRPDLEVWYTLPVLPTGLTQNGLDVVDSALAAGVALDGVNVMAMDFGESAAPTSGPNAKTMGAYAIESAESTHAQLTSLFAEHGQSFGWNQLGVTPMIGVNDVLTEVFTVADAQALEDFAIAKGLGMVSMWSVGRDTPGSLGQATPTASGLDVPAGSFSSVWNDYGTINAMDFGSTPSDSSSDGNNGPVQGGTTTVIGWHWGTDTVLDFDPAADKLDFGWFQPANFEVTEQAGSTQIEIVNNNQTYILNGVGLAEMQIGNIIALDANTVAKWQNLVGNAGPNPEPQPQLPNVSIGDAAGAEGDSGTSNLGFTVSLSEASNDVVTVGYATANGTATASSDYTAKAGTVTFNPGVTSQLVNVGVVGDTSAESNETFTITLSNPTGATISDGSATGTITNDDVATPAPGASSVVHKVNDDWGSGHVASITVTPVQALNGWTLEFDTPAKITNIWNAEIVSSTAGHYVVKNVAWNGVVGAGKSVEFGYQATPGGAASAVTNFKINGVAVGAPGPAPTLPSVSVGDAVKAEGDSGTSNLGFTVSLSEASNNPVTVGYSTSPGTATAGSDYVAKTGTVSFAPGVTSQVVNIGVVGDTVVEQNETFTITLSNAAGATIADGTAVGTITNDDVAAPQLPSVSIGNAAGAEGDSGTSNLGFTISLSEASNDAVTVGYATANGTATAGADYTAKAGTVTFNPGVTSQLVNVSVVGDTTVESNETFTITLSNAAGATISDSPATGTITNDDSDSQPGGPSVPFGSHPQDYAPGTIVPTGSQATLDAAVVALYNTWKSNFLVSAGDGQLAVRSDDADHPYVGEAQGYGLQLTALMAGADPSAQESFDGLLKYVLAHPSSINPDLHAAEQNDDFVSVNGGDSATDADLSIAYALLLADQQWGSEGTYDYGQLAVTRINAIKASEMDPNTFLPTLGDWNTPDGSYGNSTRPSDFMIDHFRAFEVATGDPFWGSAVAAAQDLVTQQQNDYAPTTGLIADFVVNTNTNPKPAPTGFLEGSTDGQYSWNSVRVPWHIGTDAAVYGDATSKAQAEKITSWFRAKTGDDPSKVVSGYTLDGTPTVNYLSPSFVATLGPAAMSGPANQAWLDEVWNYTVAQSQTSAVDTYYDASLMLQSMIVMSGNYWAPSTVTTDPGTEDPGTEDPGTEDPGTQNPGSADVTFEKTSDWGSGFNGKVTVANTGTEELSDWQVQFDFDGEISQVWNASIISHTGDRYVVAGTGQNAGIAAGESKWFGFTATPGSVKRLALDSTAFLAVTNTSVQEGDNGTSELVFDVTLFDPADDVVTVNYRTEDFSAAAGSDYEATQGTLTFAAGETAKQVHVTVIGDTVYEGNESLLLVLSDLSGAQFDDFEGVGLINNDDANPNPDTGSEYKVVGYFTEWSIYSRGYEVADIPADKLTHINYAFADINDDGEVVFFDREAAIVREFAGDSTDQPIKGNFNQLSKLKEQNPDLETLISIGGWTLSKNFSDVAATPQSREKFAASAVEFMTTYGFDGIDLDWEYPVEGGESNNVYRPEDGANYVLLVEEIRRQLEELEAIDGVDDQYLLTIAAPAGYDKIENYDLDGMEPYLDWFQVMAYDFYGAGWSNQTGNFAGLYGNPDAVDPLYNADYAVNLYLEQVDPSMIVLGAPLYGHSWKGVPDGGDGGLNDMGTGAGEASYLDQNGNISYLHIVELLEEHPDLYQVYWDDQAKASYLYNEVDGTFISYESPKSLKYKLDYIKSLGLGGIMFWEIDDDVRDYNDPRSLIGLAANELLDEHGDAV